MPIKMTGSVRPTSLTSPDPISMPIINKLPALKAKVIDIRDNGPGTPAPSVLFIESDYQAVSDKKAVLDVTTGLEWLDLSETVWLSINNVTGLLGTTYAGWRFPTESEVHEMLYRMYPDIPNPGTLSTNPATDIANNITFRDFHGYLGSNYTYGLYKRDNGDVVMSGARIGGDMKFMNLALPTDLFAFAGVFLVSDGGTTLSSIADPSINTPFGA